MRIAEFNDYLKDSLKPRAAKDRISRCKKVEAILGVDLDEAFRQDGGERVMNSLKYTIKDFRAGKPAPSGFTFKEGSNINQRMIDLRSSVNSYFKFCSKE